MPARLIINFAQEPLLQQDEQTEQIASAITEMSASVAEIAGHASSTSESTKTTIDIASEGQKIVDKNLHRETFVSIDRCS